MATIGLASCDYDPPGLNDPMPNRHLTCVATSDKLCLPIANLAMSPAANLEPVPVGLVSVQVNLRDCSDIGRGPNGPRPPATRCWKVWGTHGGPHGVSMAFERWVYESPDGSLTLVGAAG